MKLAPEFKSPNVPVVQPVNNNGIDTRFSKWVRTLAPYYTLQTHTVSTSNGEYPILSLELERKNHTLTIISDELNRIFKRYTKNGLVYPVSTSGLKEYTDGIGSYRFCAHSGVLAKSLTYILSHHINKLNDQNWKYLNVSQYFRFMRYADGGEHFPHYDSDFHYTVDGKDYATRYSLVMYFDDLETGEFAFTKHEAKDVPNLATAIALDFDRQATEEEIAVKFPPRMGRILMFPHELCHTVLPFTENKSRRIIRGDLLFGKKS